MADDNVLDLTTEIPAPYQFTVDGEPFDLYTYEHLSKDDEAHVQALFRRHTRETKKLAESRDDREAEAVASKNRDTRIDILCALTSMPRDVAERLPLGQQAKLMKEVASRLRAQSVTNDEEE